MIFRSSVFLAIMALGLGQSAVAQENGPSQTTASRELSVTVGKSKWFDSPQTIERIAGFQRRAGRSRVRFPRPGRMVVNGLGSLAKPA